MYKVVLSLATNRETDHVQPSSPIVTVTGETRNSYNPYEDKTLREGQPDNPELERSEPFNDAIRHSDIITGYRQNRTLSDYPRKIRPLIRISATVALLGLVAAIVMRFVQ